MSKHHRSYGTKAEYEHRLKVFAENYERIHSHNTHHAAKKSYKKAVNKFSDISEKEFKQMLGYKPHFRRTPRKAPKILPTPNAPTTID
jgi:hypothetical protein